MKCPRDHAILEQRTKGRLEIHRCLKCQGFQISLAQLSAAYLGNQLSRPIEKAESVRLVDCLASPYTDKDMKRFSYRGVILDYCEESDSVWFDRSEYSKIFLNQNTLLKKNNKALDVWSGVDLTDVSTDISDVTYVPFDFLGEKLAEFFSGFYID